MKNAILISCLSLLCLPSGKSQVPSNPLGLNPPMLRWQQINTEKVQVIFPSNMDSSAQRVANIIHFLHDRQPGSIGELKDKISIVLHNQTVIPNGFVTVGPFRSEFYLTPPQNNVSTDWLDYLTIHEYRHVQQFTNATRGISQLTKKVLGSWSWGGMVSLALPRWFLEGDAVCMETALTNSGRGRSPLFDMEYRALIQDGRQYSYEKAAAGSLRTFVPDWYKLGYHLTSYARKKYGPDIWKEVVADAGSYKGLFFPFSKSLQRKIGLGTKDLYLEMMADLKKNTISPASEQLPLEKQASNTLINQTNPVFLADGGLIYYENSYHNILAVMERNSAGKTIKHALAGVQIEHPQSTLSAAGDLICWAELAFDPRWANKNYSIIRIYDRSTRKKKTLSRQSKYFSPALNPAGTAIITAEVTPEGQSRLLILHAKDGSILQRIPNPTGYFFAYPQWMPGKSELIAVARKDHLTGLVSVDPTTGSTKALTPFLPYQLLHPVMYGDYILFSAAYTGIQNIFAVKPEEGNIYQVTQSSIGAFQPGCSPDGKTLVYSEFSANGYQLKTTEFNVSHWKPYVPDQAPYYIRTFDEIAAQEEGNILDKVPRHSFETSKFNRFSGIINPHSLLPLIEPPIGGLRLLSDNTFSTLSAEMGAYYNYNENNFFWEADLSYAEWYPEVNLGFKNANRRAAYFNFSPDEENNLIYTSYTENWTEQDFSAGVGLPLNLSRGSFATRLYAEATWHNITNRVGDGFSAAGNYRDTLVLDSISASSRQLFSDLSRSRLTDGNIQAIDLQFQFSSFQRLARQNIYPRWGLILRGNYRSTLGKGEWQGSNLYGRADLYLPGAFRNHGLLLQGLYQETDMLDNYRFANIFFFPRGYNSYTADQTTKLAINYAFPITYPDIAVGGLVFLQRIKANLFTDTATLKYNFPFEGSQKLTSSGIELTFDFRLFRVLDMNLGLRYSYLWNKTYAPQSKVHQFDFLLLGISG